jgi:pantothenate kinase-related protein Tda10
VSSEATTGPDGAARVLELATGRPPTLGRGRLVCVDGPAGSGKSTLASALVRLAPDAVVVHMDDLYAGWDGLPDVADQLEGLLRPLAGCPGATLEVASGGAAVRLIPCVESVLSRGRSN